MHEDLQKLTGREKETLRLLLAGHDAKSAARFLGLSVHTVNERLRDARTKLGVTTSREAARRLAGFELNGPNLSVDKQLGVARSPAPAENEQPNQHQAVGLSLAWLAGGMLVMSLIIAAAVLSFAMQESQGPAAPGAVAAATSQPAPESAGSRSARDWLAYLDDKRWDESWRSAGAFFRSQASAGQWAATIQSVREPLGSVSSRALQSVSTIANPSGPTEVIQFQTNFANKSQAIEVVTVAQERTGWKVLGYFLH